MNVGTDRLTPVTFNRHLVARQHQKAKGKRGLIASLMLTSMVDMFALLVIFLLQSFSTSPEILVSEGVALPSARTGQEAQDAPVLAVDKDSLYLDHKKIGLTEEVVRKPDELIKRLAELRGQWEASHPNETFPGKINFQADRAVNSATVSRIMAMLATESYGSILLAVMTGESG
jgi:biopolymer transport protein ExbD